MNCEAALLMLNAALDGELSPEEQTAMQRHLAECVSCQESWAELQTLHQDLGRVIIAPPVEPAVRRLMGSLQPVSNRPQKVTQVSNKTSILVMASIACTLLLTVGVIFQSPSPLPTIAEISIMKGPIEYKPANATHWSTIQGKQRVSLEASSKIRTGSTSLCEIRTGIDAVLRLNSATELVLLEPEKVELVAGELWCRTPDNSEIQIRCSSQASDSSSSSAFTCPSGTEMQWKALPNHELSCQDLTERAVEVQSPELRCTVEPGQGVTFIAGKPAAQTTRFDVVDVTNWQLPLLVLRPPHDYELQNRLTSTLALIGRSKASFLYEEQIRALGPAGVVPLLAYVRSKESINQPDVRHRAMEMISEMATLDSVNDLNALLRDQDPIIRSLSLRTLTRLQPTRDFTQETL